MNATASNIEVGRLVHFFAGYGSIDGDGLIYAVHGTPNPEPARSIFGGVGRVIRANDCQVDVVLFDGRTLKGINQCGIDRPGIGIKLTHGVAGPEVIEAALQNAEKYEADKEAARIKARSDFEANEAARKIERAPIFYYNGIRDEKGAKLQPCWYSKGDLLTYPAGTITIYARDYNRFSQLVANCFAVTNDTDTQVDYFDKDHIRVIPAHPLYPKVLAAFEANIAHQNKRCAKREAKYRVAA